MKFLGMLIDKILTWNFHIDYISRVVGIIAWLRYCVPLNKLIQICRSLIFHLHPKALLLGDKR